MCCFLLILFALGPRFALVVEWIFGNRIQAAWNGWWWPLLGLIFLPWTTLMYTIVWGVGGVHGADWVVVGLGVLLDLLSYSGRFSQRAYQRRAGVPV
jgi:hypothetical protein